MRGLFFAAVVLLSTSVSLASNNCAKYQDREMNTPLVKAAQALDLACVQFFANEKDVNLESEHYLDGATPLALAASVSDAELSDSDFVEKQERATNIAVYLISKGAKIDARDNLGQTPLMRAAEKLPELASILLDLGADVNAQDNAKLTPLMHFVLQCDPGQSSDVLDPYLVAMRMIVEKGANTTLKNREGLTALGIAQAKENEAGMEAGTSLLVRYLQNIGAK